MNKHSLNKEIKKLRYILKKIDADSPKMKDNERKLATYILVGVVTNLNNLLSSGIYGNNDPLTKECSELIDEARNTAIHYGYFNDYAHIEEISKKVVSKLENDIDYNYADLIQGYTIPNNYFHIKTNVNTNVCPSTVLNDFYVFKNINTNKALYVPKEDLITVTNKTGSTPSYLLKKTEQESFFFKDGESVSQKLNFEQLLKTNFLSGFQILNNNVYLNDSINKIVTGLTNNPYKYLSVLYHYNDTSYFYSAHSIINDLVFNRTIEERILEGKYSIKESKLDENFELDVAKLPIKQMAQKATLNDIFFMEVYLKRYQSYRKVWEYNQNNEYIGYAKQSCLLDLFSLGFNYLSKEFISSDQNHLFLDFYHAIKRGRNTLAHTPLDVQDRDILMSKLEIYSDTIYNLFTNIVSITNKQHSENALSIFSKAKNSEGSYIYSEKSNNYYLLNHSNNFVVIDGKKYLKISDINCYLELTSSSLFSLNYNTLISKECLTPTNNARFVKIDFDNEDKITKFTYTPENIIKSTDTTEYLSRAFEYLKAHPQYYKNNGLPQFITITFYDKKGNATHSENLKDLLLRAYTQKIIPSQLVANSSLIISKNIDVPLMIKNKEGELIAKIYLACLENDIDGTEKLKQLLKNKDRKDIEYGKLLPKDLKTNDIVIVRKR